MKKISALVAVAVLLVSPALGGWNDQSDDREYRVVVNHEEQYSIWFADRKSPTPWKDAGFTGTKKECLDHIEEVWTDMRPLSWRKHWGENEGR